MTGPEITTPTMSAAEAQAIASALDTLAAIDEGAHTDTADLLRLRDLVQAQAGEIRLEIVAMDQEALLSNPSPVFIRYTPDLNVNNPMGVIVELRGTPDDVAAFVAEHWGMEEAEGYPEIAGLIAPGADGRRKVLVRQIASGIEACQRDWERGAATSPDARDYVRLGVRVVEQEAWFAGTTEEGEEFLADEIAEDQGERWSTAEDLAGHIYDVLAADSAPRRRSTHVENG